MREARRSAIDILFTLALFCVFCASALAVVVIEAFFAAAADLRAPPPG